MKLREVAKTDDNYKLFYNLLIVSHKVFCKHKFLKEYLTSYSSASSRPQFTRSAESTTFLLIQQYTLPERWTHGSIENFVISMLASSEPEKLIIICYQEFH